MNIATVKLKGISPYSQSQALKTERPINEQFGEFEKRIWRERIHEDEHGMTFMPAMGFKNCLASIAKYLGMKVPGKRMATYTKHFEAGVIVAEDLKLNVKAADVPGEWLYVPSDGKRGGGSRVWKCFPVWREWSGTLVVHVIDETISKDAFETHIRQAGNFIGVGRFRPEKNGFYGRFAVESIKWS